METTTAKHIYEVQEGDRIISCGKTVYNEVFIVKQVRRVNNIPFFIIGDAGKAIMSGHNDDRMIHIAA